MGKIIKEFKIGEKVWYQDGISAPSEYYTIDSEEQIDYSWGSTDEYYYCKETIGKLWKDSIISLDELIVCKDCGSTKVKSLSWIDPNTKEILDKEGLEWLQNFCKDCKNTVELVTRKEFEDKLVTLVITKENE